MEITVGSPTAQDGGFEVCRPLAQELTNDPRFFHYYRQNAYPFNPILADLDRFESDLCTYLGAHATGELRDPDRVSDRWATDKSIGHVSLLLATLAAGAHYSDIDYPQRLEISTDFGRSNLVVEEPSLRTCSSPVV